MFPPDVTISASVYHLDASNEYPASADATVSGALIPMDRHAHALEGGVFTDPHEFYCHSSADVRVSDKLVIDSTTYYVKRVFSAPISNLKHKRATLSTEP